MNLRPEFEAWCTANGYRAREHVDIYSPIGDAVLHVGPDDKVTLEITRPIAECVSATRCPGFKHGYAYPLMNVSPEEARSFFGPVSAPIIHVCPCGRKYDAASWEALPLVGHSCFAADDRGPEEHIEQRNCPCESTRAVPVKRGHAGTCEVA